MTKVMIEVMMGGMSAKKRSRLGRPWKGNAPRTQVFQVRMTKSEQRALKALAKERGCSMADLLLAVIRKES